MGMVDELLIMDFDCLGSETSLSQCNYERGGVGMPNTAIEVTCTNADPTMDPTAGSTDYPTRDPTREPTFSPTLYPTFNPTAAPTAAKLPPKPIVDTGNCAWETH